MVMLGVRGAWGAWRLCGFVDVEDLYGFVDVNCWINVSCYVTFGATNLRCGIWVLQGGCRYFYDLNVTTMSHLTANSVRDSPRSFR